MLGIMEQGIQFVADIQHLAVGIFNMEHVVGDCMLWLQMAGI